MLVDPDGKAPRGFDPPTKVSNYSYQRIRSNYEKRGQKLLNREGSALSYLANTNPPTNTCAIRMCDALNESGYSIPTSQSTPTDVRIQNGREADSGNFVLDAESMGNYLADVESPTLSFDNLDTEEKIAGAMEKIDKLGDFKGIIVLTAGDKNAYQATGHVDLLYRDMLGFGDMSFYSNGGTDLDDYLKANTDAKLSIQIWKIQEDED